MITLQAYNIRTGAQYFANTLESNNGNVLLTLGNYNGWPAGMTHVSAHLVSLSRINSRRCISVM